MMRTNEVWKIVEDHPNYMISSTGKLLNIKRGRYLKGSPNNSGYLQYSFRVNGVVMTEFAHRLVAKAFVPNPKNLPEVNHKDKDIENNDYENLEWVTQARNAEHAKAKDCLFVSPEGVLTDVYNLNKFCRENKLDQSAMTRVVKGTRKSHKGWKKG